MIESVVVECASGVRLRLSAGDAGLRAIDLRVENRPEDQFSTRHPLLRETQKQLRAYFARRLRQFDLPLDPQGTGFQKRVWKELETIPFGEVRSYAQIAIAIGAPNAVRAVGAANGANPLPIVIPCHRVIGSNGRLTGYGGGLPLKQRLLELEGCHLPLFAG
jgi:methylated-DNA-[protein]-cysteine S-methyltransferase